ncbi:MAG TPA: PmeII family type II restriction endonuclease [Burkholderiaceae bacterium]|jgi:hypothetical protein|nr:PmeII family type II restriction endonuclease [Burkholderiaceae bacterium]
MELFEKTRTHVADTIGTGFHHKRLRKLKKAKLTALLSKSNPLLMRAQAVDTAKPIVKELLDAYAAKSDRGLFADFMKQVAIWVATEANAATAPRTDSVDAEFTRDGRHYALVVKPRSNWGNERQITKTMDAVRAATTAGQPADVTLLIGSVKGKGTSEPAPQCEKLSGPDFWRFISNDPQFETHLIDILETDAHQHAKKFLKVYKDTLKSLTEEFEQAFCDSEGKVQWHLLAEFNGDDEDEEEEGADDDTSEEDEGEHAAKEVKPA